MGKKYKKKVQWRQLSLKELQPTSGDKDGEECEEEEEGEEGGSLSPTQESGCPYSRPYPRPPHQYAPPNHYPRRGAHHNSGGGFYYRNFDKRFDRRGGFENIRNLENRSPYKPGFYDRHYQYEKYGGRPPYCSERGGYKFGYGDRGGRRPFRPYGRPGFFHKGFPGHQFPDERRNTGSEEYFDQEEDEEEWEEAMASEEHQHNGCNGDERPSQPVHTVMINNEEYTKIQTPRQEVIFKKSSLDRRQDSLDQSSVTGSTTSASASSSTTGAADGTPGGTGSQIGVDQESVSGSLEDNTPSVTGDDLQEQGGVHDHIFEDPGDIFVNENGGPPLAGVVMQQAFPGGPMYTIPVHWTPFIDPSFIPGETALTPLDPAFTHVIDPKSLPIDPVHILPVQHDAAGCPVQVQVKVDSNGVPIQIEPSAFTVSLSTIPQHQQRQEQPITDTTAATQDTVTSSEHFDNHETVTSSEHFDNHETVTSSEHSDDQLRATSSDNFEKQENAIEAEAKEGEEEEKIEVESEKKVLRGETNDTQDTLTDAGKTQEDKGDELCEMEVEEGSKEMEEEEDEEGEEAKDEKTQTQQKQQQQQHTTSADPSTQSSSCDQNEKVDKDTTEQETQVKERRIETEDGKGKETSEGGKEQRRVSRGKAMEEEEEDEEDEEEEEEEDMLTKESEEGSDSSDSQYASMSEASTTPTTPSGELTDPHETPTPAHASPPTSTDTAKTQDMESDSQGNQEETRAVSTEEGERSVSEAPGDSQTDSQTAEEGGDEGIEATPKISQGYVMVPILTPYYDPSVFYGYPVVVPAQQQQVVVPAQQHPQPSPPPQHHHHSYSSKKKKKKYQRRRQVENQPPPGSYLDPQLYTGEPFVATPGGYVVPLETAASVCQIHGIQYVTPAFHQQLPDEGFVSVQHSPYLPDVAPEPPAAEAQTQEGTNSQSDTARTVFSDLQDTERQQIQEILQEHNKVSKTDSTESSDSGVSESEEAAHAEASSDELESRQEESLEQSAPESEESPEHAEELTTSASQCQEDSATSQVLEDTQQSSQHSSIQTTTTALTPAELCIVSVQGDAEVCVPNESQACQTEEATSEGQKLIEEVADTHENNCIEEDKEGDAYIEDGLEHTVAAEGSDHQIEEEEDSSTCEIEVKDDDIVDKEDNNDNIILTQVTEENNTREVEISSESVCSEDTLVDTSVSDNETEIFAQENEESFINNNNNTSIIDVDVDNQNSDSSPDLIKSESCDEVNETPSNECIASSSIIDENISCNKSEGVSLEGENLNKNIDSCSEVNDDKRQTSSKESCEERDKTLPVGRLKELKVTEAVTRWIREVTPEKAFTLSEEVQSRLLADQESVGEIESEDEYIEDEMATETTNNTIPEPKNVRGNPFVAVSSESPVMGAADTCSKRVALINKFRGTTPDTIDDYDGSSTISNLSVGNLHSEASSCIASVNQSFDEDIEKYAGNPEMYDPSAYAKYYQLGIEVDEITPTATPPLVLGMASRGVTPSRLITSETASECGSEDIDSVPHKYEMTQQVTDTSPLSLATEILKAEKVIHNMVHITGDRESSAVAEQTYGNPDLYLKHYDAISRNEVSDSGVQSEESSDETEGRSLVGSSGVGSSLASTPAVSPAHHLTGRPPLHPYPLKNLSVGEGPVPCKTVCCAVM